MPAHAHIHRTTPHVLCRGSLALPADHGWARQPCWGGPRSRVSVHPSFRDLRVPPISAPGLLNVCVTVVALCLEIPEISSRAKSGVLPKKFLKFFFLSQFALIPFNRWHLPRDRIPFQPSFGDLLVTPACPWD